MKRSIYDRLTVGTACGGHVKVTIEYRGKLFSSIITDMTLYDDYVREAHVFNTWKQAARIMYNWVKRDNNLR